MDELGLTEEARTQLQSRQTELVRLIEALARLDKSKEWHVVKELVFDRSLASIDRQLMTESLRPELYLNKIYKLQGERDWSNKFSDPHAFIESLKRELANIKKRINEQ